MKTYTIIFLGPNFQSATVIIQAETPADAVLAGTEEFQVRGFTVPVGLFEGEHTNIMVIIP